jgi:hypothetical protein
VFRILDKNPFMPNKITKDSSIQSDRKTFTYRLLESSLAIVSTGFIIAYILLAFFSPTIASIFILIYSLIWIFKVFLNILYTIYSYKQFLRWYQLDWGWIGDNFAKPEKFLPFLYGLRDKHQSKLDWKKKIQSDIQAYHAIEGTKFGNMKNVFHVAVFATYNEGPEVLSRSLRFLKDSKWSLDKLIVVVSQEARNGAEKNKITREGVAKENWLTTTFLDETKDLSKIPLSKGKLNVFFTEHPDGMVGEIKGKASNEDWGARKAATLIEAKKIDQEMVLVTSLDADSHIGQYFFHNLSFRYCLTLERNRRGFQPVHVYSNNFFQTSLWPRQVATQTTIYNLTNLSLDEEMSFFAIYSVPLTVLKKVDYWVREVIAEDSLLFMKCFTAFDGNFKIVPHYGIFEGDAVEADEYIEEIINQYKQLQRWSWGGVEGIPYLFKHLFIVPERKNTPLLKRVFWLYLLFSSHFFWSTTPIIVFLGPLLPQLIQDERFRSTNIAQNLSQFSQYFSWISFIMMTAFIALTFHFLIPRANKTGQKLSLRQISVVLIQFLISPFIFIFMSVPAIDSQFRGLIGKYLGYWVTPKS